MAQRTPKESRTTHVLPLGTDKALRAGYVNHFGDARIGLLLEHLDRASTFVA